MDGGQDNVVKEEPIDEMNADVGQYVTNSQFIKQDPEEMAVNQEPDESINEIPSINERKRHASSSVSAISANETMDDDQDDVMIIQEITRVPRSKMNKLNDEVKQEPIEPSSESAASENSASSIDQQDLDIAKIIEHEKVLKFLSKSGCVDLEGRPASEAFKLYKYRTAKQTALYYVISVDGGFEATSIAKVSRRKRKFCGRGNGSSKKLAKRNAAKDALVREFPNILFDASDCILRIGESMKRRLLEIQGDCSDEEMDETPQANPRKPRRRGPNRNWPKFTGFGPSC